MDVRDRQNMAELTRQDLLHSPNNIRMWNRGRPENMDMNNHNDIAQLLCSMYMYM